MEKVLELAMQFVCCPETTLLKSSSRHHFRDKNWLSDPQVYWDHKDEVSFSLRAKGLKVEVRTVQTEAGCWARETA